MAIVPAGVRIYSDICMGGGKTKGPTLGREVPNLIRFENMYPNLIRFENMYDTGRGYTNSRIDLTSLEFEFLRRLRERQEGYRCSMLVWKNWKKEPFVITKVPSYTHITYVGYDAALTKFL